MGTQFSALDSKKPRKTSMGETVPTRVELPEWEAFGFNMRSAAALFALLGAARTFRGKAAPAIDSQYGAISIAEARRLVMAARARFAKLAPVVIGELAHVEGFSAMEVGGRVLRSPPFGIEELGARLDSFAAFVDAAASAGADLIQWS